MINFNFEHSGNFPISRITAYNIMLTCLLKNVYEIITNHLRYNKLAQVELN